ncbi:hypothetical protein [Sandaracinus amylolyticus]|uniref:hypothetical protein n=1 Tax=Sandaracinus amylolyticus TaxID=927083 RepID=UPI001F25E70D|nr:hypothetical protein [Sandaracinus amylolyticus]UJR86288.1 Hypothetical protein I5071_83720 [Sandaracinus amylolyticus]
MNELAVRPAPPQTDTPGYRLARALLPALVVLLGLGSVLRSEPPCGDWVAPRPDSFWLWLAIVPFALASMVAWGRVQRARHASLRLVWDGDEISLREGPIVRATLRWSESRVCFLRRDDGSIAAVTIRDDGDHVIELCGAGVAGRPGRSHWVDSFDPIEPSLKRAREVTNDVYEPPWLWWSWWLLFAPVQFLLMPLSQDVWLTFPVLGFALWIGRGPFMILRDRRQALRDAALPRVSDAGATYRDAPGVHLFPGPTDEERRIQRERARFALIDCALGVLAALAFFALS